MGSVNRYRHEASDDSCPSLCERKGCPCGLLIGAESIFSIVSLIVDVLLHEVEQLHKPRDLQGREAESKFIDPADFKNGVTSLIN